MKKGIDNSQLGCSRTHRQVVMGQARQSRVNVEEGRRRPKRDEEGRGGSRTRTKVES